MPREPLSQAGFKAPYVLMPHSISSVYGEYYAAQYPAEVEAIVSLDGTSSAFYADMPAIVKVAFPILKFQQAIGTTSLMAALTANKKRLLSNGYTQKEINDEITFASFVVNDTMLAQIANSAEFVKQVMGMPFPATVPYFKVIAKQTYETPNKQLKMTPQEYQRQHLERIGAHANFEVLDGTHFIYINNVNRIAEIVDDLLSHEQNQEQN